MVQLYDLRPDARLYDFIISTARYASLATARLDIERNSQAVENIASACFPDIEVQPMTGKNFFRGPNKIKPGMVKA